MSVEVVPPVRHGWRASVVSGIAWVFVAAALVVVGAVVATAATDSQADLTIRSWRMPDWAGPIHVWTWLGGLFLLVLGPQPWRATRWAWFWVMSFVPPFGLAAFLLLGGGTGLAWPRNLNRRLTGGWAFILMLLLTYLVGKLGITTA